MTNERTPPKLLPPHYFAISVGLMFFLGYYLRDWGSTWVPVGQLTGNGTLAAQLVGGLLLGGGVIIAVLGSRRFAAVDTNIIPFTKSTTLVTDSVFSVSRNPMYLGMLFALCGIALFLNQLLPWLVVISFFCIIRWGFIRHEEALMHNTFGDDYVEYCARVRRWL